MTRGNPAARGLTAMLLTLCCLIGRNLAAQGQALPAFDFAASQNTLGWAPTHDVARLQASPNGLNIEINGNDPYIIGPARDLPAGQPLWLRIRLKSEQGGMAQVFYFQNAPTEKDSVRFNARPGVWEETRVPLPPLGPGFHLRFDPPGDGGTCLIARMAFEPRTLYKEPEWLPPDPPAFPTRNITVQSGDLRLVMASPLWNEFAIEVAGQPMAIGHTRPLIGVLDKGAKEPRWIDIGQQPHSGNVDRKNNVIVNDLGLTEPDGTTWKIRQRFAPAAIPGAITVDMEISVSQEKNILFLPMLVLLPGSGSFGETKDHALFAGLEYLDKNEPSSSEADIVGPGSHRQVPDSLKSTLPLMAIQANERYIGLAWQPDPAFCALFDSPDRHFHSNGHVMGILYPGSDGNNRMEGSLLPYEGQTLKAGTALTLHATILGGKGTSVVPAVQQYVALRGLPALPKSGMDKQKYLSLAAAGWLDSGLGEGGKYRHALPGTFMPQPAADAAVMMEWLAQQTNSETLPARLKDASQNALAQVPAGELNFSGVGHVRVPLPSLVYGHTLENAERAQQVGRDLLRRFEADGTIPYRPSANGLNYGRTHFAPDANGLTAQVVTSLLEAACFSGDPALINEGLRVLRALDKFADSAPRGAQTWEVPLHTPDILASAYLVRAYTQGYALTGEPHFLDLARYWAWTGIPFVYLTPPNGEPARAESGSLPAAGEANRKTDPVGVYATIPVYGATQWVAPDWMGLPVQWCGLVYSDALYRLAKYDPNPLWKAVADGITVSGIQQTWPRGSNTLRQGLLPDSFNLRPQTRNDSAINPGTLQINAVQYLTGAPLYDFQAFHANGLILVHAPGPIRETKEEAGKIRFTIEGWPRHTYDILIVGLKAKPQVRVNEVSVPLTAPNEFQTASGRLVLHLEGKKRIELDL